KAEDPLLIKKPGPKAPFRLNREELKAYMEANPEASMKKIADHFGVANSTVWYACQKLS
ncbi:MAG: winged helix-turn-helix transcriptional regulator, partial [Alphaproteobacteria bacterium]|nr:winged helix-turn-helix transcriptional regulator [Alphaproteobacteria bacterium]